MLAAGVPNDSFLGDRFAMRPPTVRRARRAPNARSRLRAPLTLDASPEWPFGRRSRRAGGRARNRSLPASVSGICRSEQYPARPASQDRALRANSTDGVTRRWTSQGNAARLSDWVCTSWAAHSGRAGDHFLLDGLAVGSPRAERVTSPAPSRRHGRARRRPWDAYTCARAATARAVPRLSGLLAP